MAASVLWRESAARVLCTMCSTRLDVSYFAHHPGCVQALTAGGRGVPTTVLAHTWDVVDSWCTPTVGGRAAPHAALPADAAAASAPVWAAATALRRPVSGGVVAVKRGGGRAAAAAATAPPRRHDTPLASARLARRAVPAVQCGGLCACGGRMRSYRRVNAYPSHLREAVVVGVGDGAPRAHCWASSGGHRRGHRPPMRNPSHAKLHPRAFLRGGRSTPRSRGR